jgi:hypothetical protein
VLGAWYWRSLTSRSDHFNDYDVLATAMLKGILMKIVLNLIGALLTLNGVIWFLQGINVLPGSFMTGQIKWAYYGAASLLVGAAVLWRNNRRR